MTPPAAATSWRKPLLRLFSLLLLLVGTAHAADRGGILGDADDRFVDSVAGVDPGNCSGGTFSNPWRTVSKVNDCVNTTGGDVYFKSGSVFTQTLTIDWTGTSSNGVVVGCYFERAGLPFECTLDLPKPIFRGTYTSSCRNPTFTCDVNNSNARPTSEYSPMILRIKDMQYVTVRNMRIESSAGEGIQFTDGNPNVGMTPSYGIMEHNEVVEAYGTGLNYNNAANNTYGIIRDNYVDQTSLKYVDSGATPWPPCLFVNGRAGPNATQKVLVEGNRVNNCGGESIGILRVHNNIIRRNIVSNSRRVQTYLDNAKKNVVEQNQYYGLGAYGATNDAGQATATTSEPYGPESIMSDSIDNMWRNNIMANYLLDGLDAHMTTTSTIPGQPGNPAQLGYQTGAWYYGNSLFSDRRVIRSYNLTINNNVDELRYSTNLFQGTGGCSVQTNAPPVVSYDRNQWENLPSQTDCRGTNLVQASAGVTYNWRAIDGDNVPADPSVFTPAAGTSGLDAGDPALLTADCLNINDYGQAYWSINRGRPPAEALWEKCMAMDFFEKTRSSPPDIGAIER